MVQVAHGIENKTEIARSIQRARARLLQMHFESGVGHIGGNLSCLDLMMITHHRVMQPEDRFLLSKGHAAGALYITLWSLGILQDEDLRLFHRDGAKLSGHPAPHFLPQIPFATGSLGHGLSLASGLALGKQLVNAPGRIYCLLSDGEWQEGSTWEALLFAQRHQLPLTFLIDTNGLQGFGTTWEVAGQGPLTAKLRAFGVKTREIDGHDLQEIEDALCSEDGGLIAIVARTRKGQGVSYMQDRMEWHYLPMSPEQYAMAHREVLEA